MLEDIVLVATGTLEVVPIMKGISVYHHLHLRRRGKLLSCCAISTSSDNGVVQLATGGAVKEVF